MQQEQRLKDYQAYCGLLKDKTDHDFIAQCFPTLVFFSKKKTSRKRNTVNMSNCTMTLSRKQGYMSQCVCKQTEPMSM
jgi:hypothetical protein